MRIFLIPAIAAAAFVQPAIALEMPNKLICKVSGHAGCGDICVGGGIKDRSIRMAIDFATRTVTLNGLKGHIAGDMPISVSGNYDIQWRWGVIGLHQMSLISKEDGRTAVTLTDRQNELQFACR